MEVVVSPVRLVFNVDSINSVAVSSNWLYLTGGPSSVVCINLDSPSKVNDIALPRKLAETAGQIRQIYTDVSGSTVLAITSRYEHFFYMQKHRHTTESAAKSEFKHLAKLKGTSTICASFHPSKPNVFLLGTRAGNIVEVIVDSTANETYFKRDLKVAQQVWKSPQKDAVNSLLITTDEKRHPEVLATCGSSVFRWRFDPSSHSYNQTNTDSILQGLFDAQPETILHGKRPSNLTISPNGENFGVILDKRRIALKHTEWQEVEVVHPIQKLLVSDYYALVITSSKTDEDSEIVAINLYNHNHTMSFPVPGESHISGAVVDHKEQTFWIYNQETLMELKLENELKGMWKFLADQHQYAEALAIADSRAQKSSILAMNAQHEFNLGNFKEAAALFGASDAPLEVIALDFMRKFNDAGREKLGKSKQKSENQENRGDSNDKNDKDNENDKQEIEGEDDDEEEQVMKALLLARLKHTKSKAQQTMLTAWLSELGDLSWLNEPKVHWDVDLVCSAVAQRGKFDEIVPILVGVGDIENAVTVLINKEQYRDALDLLRQHEHLASVYRHASVLLDHEPRATVDSWMRIKDLDSVKLVPTLLQYSQHHRGAREKNEALRFLMDASQKQPRSIAIFNAVVTILATYADSTGENDSEVSDAKQSAASELMRYLLSRAAKLDNLDFALRVCLQHNQTEAAVFLATEMGLFEDAVQLCLASNNPDMIERAIEIADKETVVFPGNSNSNNEELRKVLLREIAQRLIKIQGPQASIRFTKLLRVDDLLSQFPDFETLNELAPEIVKSLERTNARLSSLDTEISESLAASETMQRELQEFKRKPVLVEPGEACYLCDFPLVTRKFVVFPCQHGFHLDCIHRERPNKVATEECILCSVDNLKQIDMPLNSIF